MTRRFLSLALLLVLSLMLPACKKKAPPPEEPPAPRPAEPQPKAAQSFKEKLLGKWERDPESDGYPVFMEFRANGSAMLKHRQPDGTEQVANGTVEYPQATGLGPHQLSVKVPNGGYGLLVDFEGDELTLSRRADQPPLKFRKAK